MYHYMMKYISNTSLLGILQSLLTHDRLQSYMNEPLGKGSEKKYIKLKNKQ